MSTNVLNDASALVERIISEATADAQAVIRRAGIEADAIKSQCERDCAGIYESAEAARKTKIREIMERSRTNAELDGRKYALYARRQVIDEAFSAAMSMLLSLSGAHRDQLLADTAIREADGGEEIHPAPNDSNAIARLLPSINERLAGMGKSPLALSEKDAPLKSGFVLSCPSYEKNCSFEAMLSAERAGLESRVARILFPPAE